MSEVVGNFTLTMDELRAVARFVTESAEEVLPVFETAAQADHRPRAAIDSARAFINGANRTELQRVASTGAHRAAAEVTGEAPRLAARCAGDAASAAYLHPIAQAAQVGHILRAAASAARIAELIAEGEPGTAEASIERSRRRATPVLIDILSRYPAAPPAKSPVGLLMTALDSALRDR